MPDYTPLGPEDLPLDTLGQRCWFAWHCLPRGKDAAPPSWRSLEMAHHLPNGVFSKILSGSRHTVEAATYQKLARALNVPVLWLLTGEDPPDLKTTGPFQVLGGEPQDPQELARRARTYLRRCGFEEARIEQAIQLLLAPKDEPRASFGAMTTAATRELATVLDAPSPEIASRDAALDTLRALSAGKGAEAHRAAQPLARKVLSTGLPRDALAVLTGAPTWSAAAFRLAEAALGDTASHRPPR